MTKAPPLCRQPGCLTPVFCKGFCQKHYSAARRSGDPSLKQQPPCGQEGCRGLSYAKGLCDKHYALARRHKVLESVRCVIYGCEESVFGHGLCVNHYQRKRRLERRAEMDLEDASLDEEGLSKTCERCGRLKPMSQFYRRRSVRGTGRSSWCSLCIKINKIMKSYGVSEDEALALASKAECASCGDRVSGSKSRAVDHCHQTGMVRDVLCKQCNAALGLLRDDPARIRALAAYAEKWNKVLRGDSGAGSSEPGGS